MVAPIWFIYEDGRVYFTPHERSAWREYLERGSGVCLLIDESDAPMRKVVVTGRADLVHALGHDDEWRDMYRRIALRYVPEAWADAYLHDTIDEPRGLYGVDLDRSDDDDLAHAGATRREPARRVGAAYYHRGA